MGVFLRERGEREGERERERERGKRETYVLHDRVINLDPMPHVRQAKNPRVPAAS